MFVRSKYLSKPAPAAAGQRLRRLGRQDDDRLVVVDRLAALDGGGAAAPRAVAVGGGRAGSVGVGTPHAVPVETPG